ncbi:MAG: pantoate--beta-alanine ligase [Alphaproteobacteria bacterium]|nr:pantoate--beta-alanine ligase [Alphaproteobacteria bacterium SS10]
MTDRQTTTSVTPPIAPDVAAIRGYVRRWRAAGQRVALVPTMGALHEGHLALVDAALSLADLVVVSIFVNPAQFAPHEDFDQYPRDLEGDAAKLAERGVSVIYAPDRSIMYPDGHQTSVSLGAVAEPMEGAHRPIFFTGVATVVTKLLLQVEPHIAVFGEKDYQQLAVIKQMVRDLDIDVEISGRPTEREADGLAMSSRNAYLSQAERQVAPRLNAELQAIAQALANGQPFAPLQEASVKALVGAGFDQPDYLDLRDAETLAPMEQAGDRPGRLLVAAKLGKTRLIDNIPVSPIS